jgi:hypothetical protein
MSTLHKRGGGSSSSKPWAQKLKALDAYPKVNEDFFTRTLSGGIITLVSSVIMLLLFISELREWHARTSTATRRRAAPPQRRRRRRRRAILGREHGARAVGGHLAGRDHQHQRELGGMAPPPRVRCCRTGELAADGARCRPQIDVTFPKFPCAWISLDAMDVSGDLHLDVVGGLRVGA